MSRWNNPILESQMRIRMRGMGAFISIMIYVAVLLGAVLLASLSAYFGTCGVLEVTRQGMYIYNTLAYLQFALLVLLTPALTSGLISSERERQTLDLLLCSRMGAFRIVMGKLLSGTLFVMLLVVCSLPMMALVYTVGDLRFGDVFQLMLYLLMCILTIGSMGVFFSTLVRRTTAATVVTYCMVLVYGIGTLVGGFAHSAFVTAAQQLLNPYGTIALYVSPILYTNPFMGLFWLITGHMGMTNGNGVGILSEIMRMFTNGMYYDTFMVTSWMPAWLITLISMLVVAALFVLGSMALLRRDRKQVVSRKVKKALAQERG